MGLLGRATPKVDSNLHEVYPRTEHRTETEISAMWQWCWDNVGEGGNTVIGWRDDWVWDGSYSGGFLGWCRFRFPRPEDAMMFQMVWG